MENYEYNKVFPFNIEDEDDSSPDEVERIKAFLRSYEKNLRNKPRFVLPLAPTIFEETVAACEQIVKEFCGKLKAKIDYSSFSATIEMWCCYVEFAHDEFMSILQLISTFATSIRFEPLTSGDLYILIQMPYFMTLKDTDESD